ncbi:carboxylesterase/lipase family protein [Leifsonia shinshuensis]|uniref:Carboxylic ester hydrolase n=1 Tax=Leifsonia shinshuensis TaxID=150026 RepID=A0A853CZE8_9MICO|nr:carboxylesterase family protein [Leifsonia shinshuensis]NYJ25957.1 para-nitrobenzyl esterase [Leifsonia shinshuensis]
MTKLRATSSRPARRLLHTLIAAAAATLSAVAFASPASATTAPSPAPLYVTTDAGRVHGLANGSVHEFRGIPYAAPPTGELRWRSPQPAAHWTGTRETTAYPPVCPQNAPSPNGSSEDCLYLNVTSPAAASSDSKPLPVIVFIHGGGFAIGEGADYDATKLAAKGAVVVTVDYRLGLLGFLAHPALAERPGGPAGNYGLQDQQAALRWVQNNIRQFGGDPRHVAIDGQSAGGLSVLAQLASPSAAGLFQSAIVESGAFAPQQKTLATAEAEGTTVASALGCADQSADCLRNVPLAELLRNEPLSITPGYVDGAVLREPVLQAIATGRFNRVPLLNGANTEEERIFTELGLSVTKGATTILPGPITTETYQSTIASNFGVTAATAARIAAEYPLSAYASPALAFSALNSDANFSTPALALDAAASLHVPTYAYDFNDNSAPERFVPPALGSTATHQSELQYLFDLPNAPLPGSLSADQEHLADTIRSAWVHFAATGNPATAGQVWPKYDVLRHRVLSFQAPDSKVETTVGAQHHSLFWLSLTATVPQ